MIVNDIQENYRTGWVKIFRSIANKGYYKKSEYVHLWYHLLLKASHKETEFMWNGELLKINEGQLLTGREKLSEETGISGSTIERILNLFENEHQITQEKTTKFRIITINNWNEYQGGQQTDNKRTTDGQQTDTYKNVKNDKNEKNIQEIWIRTFGRNPKLPELELTEQLINKYGYDKTYEIFKKAVLEGFNKIQTLVNSLDDKGNIKPKGGKEHTGRVITKKEDNEWKKVLAENEAKLKKQGVYNPKDDPEYLKLIGS